MNSPPFGYLETFISLSGDTLVSFSLVCFAKETLLSLGGKTGIWECVNAYWEVFVQGIRELYMCLSIWDQMPLFISKSDCMCSDLPQCNYQNWAAWPLRVSATHLFGVCWLCVLSSCGVSPSIDARAPHVLVTAAHTKLKGVSSKVTRLIIWLGRATPPRGSTSTVAEGDISSCFRVLFLSCVSRLRRGKVVERLNPQWNPVSISAATKS